MKNQDIIMTKSIRIKEMSKLTYEDFHLNYQEQNKIQILKKILQCDRNKTFSTNIKMSKIKEIENKLLYSEFLDEIVGVHQ